MEYLRLMRETFTRFMEEGFEPSGAASDRCFEIIKERIGKEAYNDLEDTFFDMNSENAFHGFLAGISFARMICVGTDKVTFPQPDDYEKVTALLRKENLGGN